MIDASTRSRGYQEGLRVAADRILDRLRTGRASVYELSKELSLNPIQVYNALTDLERAGKVQWYSKTQSWGISEQGKGGNHGSK